MFDSLAGELVPYDQAYESGFEDMRRRIPNLERIRQLIGYKPTKTLDQMLRTIIETEAQKTKKPPKARFELRSTLRPV